MLNEVSKIFKITPGCIFYKGVKLKTSLTNKKFILAQGDEIGQFLNCWVKTSRK